MFGSTNSSQQMLQTGQSDPVKRVNIRAVTYNVTNLKGRARRESLAEVFHRNGAHVAGLQETRGTCDQVIDANGFRCYCSSGCEGQFGCEVWIKRDSDWDLSTMAILVRRPRIIAIAGKCGGSQFVVVSGHALKSQKSDDQIDQWWHDFFAIMHRLPQDACPLVLLDANARYRASSLETCVPINRNAMHLDHFRSAFNMCFSGHFDAQGQRIVTWRSPRLKEDVLDYILLPRQLQGSLTVVGQLKPSEHITSEWDREPLMAQISFECQSQPHTKSVMIDREALKDVRNHVALSDIFRTVPECPWFCDVETHAAVFHEHVAMQLKSQFPCQRAKKRQPFLSEGTWILIRTKHMLRKNVRYMRVAMDKHFLTF